MATARVIVRRAGGFFGRFRRLKVLVDGVERLALRHREEQAIEVEAGAHTFQARMDWCTSAPVTLECRPGRPLALLCEPAPFFRAVRAVYAAPEKVFTIRLVDAGLSGLPPA